MPDPEVAVVVPAHRQPGLLGEALESVIAQSGARVSAVVVDDGCPFPETGEAARRAARAAPGRVHLLRRPNGGLSAARNTGVEFALSAWPGCRAVHLLDADNRMHPGLIARSLALLDGSPARVGWIYPDFDMFGLEENFSAAGEHALLHHLLDNLCEAGSLVARRVFEAGLRFDEAMRRGFEDWDFWLRAAEAGFRGRHLPRAGFRYRKRAESMLSAAEKDRPRLLAELRSRRAALLRPRPLLALEAEEAPRFLLFRTGEEAVEAVVDPLRPRRPAEDRAAARRRIVEARRSPAAVSSPPFAVFAGRGALEALARGRVLHDALWQAGRQLSRGAEAVAVGLAASPDGALSLSREAVAAGSAPILLLRSEALLDRGAAFPDGPLPGLTYDLPEAPPPLPPALPALREEGRALAEVEATRHPGFSGWRGEWRRPRGATQEGLRELLGCGHLLPWIGEAGGRDLGIVLPLMAFGGVERVVLAYARVLRGRGWRVHLFLTGADRAAPPPGALELFETVNFPEGPGVEGGEWGRLHLGAPLSGFGTWRDVSDMAGQAAPMHAVLVTHALAAHGYAAALRALGVRTFAGLHVVERTHLGQPLGNPHALLAYEAAYDGVVVVSRALRDWCEAQGVPPSKVAVVPNGPGYEADPARVAAALAARRARRGERLRALYLGRLDRQKGLERLREAAAATRGRVAWRVVGASVLRDAEEPALGLTVEPPSQDPATLDGLYAWADVLVLPSRFEGVPLTILEAQRFGVVILATRVGAVEEAVSDGVDGLLVADGPDEAVAAALVARLDSLSADPERRLALGEAAAERAAGRSWERNLRSWIGALEAGSCLGLPAEGTLLCGAAGQTETLGEAAPA